MFGLLNPGAPGFSGAAESDPMWTFVSKQSGDGATDNVSWSSLDGDTDKMYRIIGWAKSSVSARVAVEFNGSTTSQTCRAYRENPSGTWGLLSSIPGVLRATSTAGALIEITLYCDTSIGARVARSNGGEGQASPRLYTGVSIWSDTTTNVTSIAVRSNTGVLTTGSHFWLYRLTNP